MPKNRTKKKNENGAIIVTRPNPKFRIGSRKGGKSALLMSNDELIAVLDDSNKKRYHAKARTVLANRGVTIEPKVVEADNSLESLAETMKH